MTGEYYFNDTALIEYFFSVYEIEYMFAAEKTVPGAIMCVQTEHGTEMR